MTLDRAGSEVAAAGTDRAGAPRMLAAPPPTVATGAVRRVVDVALREGVPIHAVTRATRLAPAIVADPDRRVELARLIDLWAYLGKTLADESLPIRVAERATLEDLHVLGFAIMTAPTLRHSLATFTRYSALLTDCGHWEATESGKRVEVRSIRARPPTLGHRLSNETAVAQFIGCLRQLAQADVEPLEVCFRHATPRRLAAHSAFFRCRVEFGASHEGFSFRRDLLDCAPPAANEALWTWLCQRARSACADLAPRPLVDAVRHHVVRELSRSDGAVPSAADIAHALGTTERTLRRRLGLEETSVRRVVEEVRRERATTLLQTPGVSVTDAALRLGFSDTTAFTHACHRWFGCAPSELRRRLR